jgi:hypothetical protein
MLGLRFSRLVRAAIASGALVLAACKATGSDTDSDGANETGETTGVPVDPTTGVATTAPPADAPPALVAVEFLDPTTLQLSFTEPIAPTGSVNPKRFRIGLLVPGYDFDGTHAGTKLYSPEYFNPNYDCPPCYDTPPYYCGPDEYCTYVPSALVLVSDVVDHASDPSKVILLLTEEIRPTLCQFINQDNPFEKPMLHIHYADGGLAQITDLAGLPLPALREEWVKAPGDFASYDGPPASLYDPFLPIPCPF